MSRRSFRLSLEQYTDLLAQMSPEPSHGLAPRSPTQRYTLAWEALGIAMGFDAATVLNGSERREFSAVFYTANEEVE